MQTSYLLPFLIAFCSFISIIALYYYLERLTRARLLKERLSAFTNDTSPAAKMRSKGLLLQSQTQTLLERNFGSHLKKTMNLNKRLKSKLFYSPVKLPVGQALFFGSFIFYGVSTLAETILHQGEIIDYAAGLLVSGIFVMLYLDFIKSRREKEFTHDFSTALDVIIRGLKAGISIERTFTTVGKEIRGPVGAQFQHIMQHINFGVPFDEALKESAERVNNNDFNFFVVALIIQRKTGGSIADLMQSIRVVLRSRQELRLKVDALSAEAKASGVIVGLMPTITLLIISYLNPDYVEFFQKDPTGQKLILVALGLIVTGAYVIKRLTNFKV